VWPLQRKSGVQLIRVNWKTALLALFVLFAVGFGGFRWWAAHALEEARQRIRDAGYPVNYAELDAYYALPAGAENRAPVLLYAIDNLVQPDNRLFDRLPIVGEPDLPHRSEPIPDEMAQAMLAYSLLNLDTVGYLYEALEYEHCRMPVDMNAGPAMLLEHLAQLRALGRLLEVRAIHAALEGKPDEAARHLAGIFETADSLSLEPILISQLVRVAVCGIGFSGVEQTLNRIELTPAGLERLQSVLTETDAEKAFARGFAGEQCMWGYVEDQGPGVFGGGGANLDLQDLWFSLIYRPSGLMDLDGVRYYAFFEKAIATMDLPVEEQYQALAALNEMEHGGVGSLTAILLPSLGRAVEADLRNRAQLRAAIVGVAAERYRAEHGEYPETIDALVPAFLDAVPLDPFGGGAPIRYRRLENGFVAYSVAPNHKDDGGVEMEKLRDALQKGDLTFTVERGD
jgi:hypothetical protein